MANLAEQVLSLQKEGFKSIVYELDEIVKRTCVEYGECNLGYCGGDDIDMRDSYYSACIPEKYRKLAIMHYRSEGLEVTELFTPGGNFKGLKISL